MSNNASGWEAFKKYDFLRKHIAYSTKRYNKIKRAYIRGSLVAATDGSALTGAKGSMTYILSKDNDRQLFSSFSPVLGDSEYCNSDRAELFAILAVITHLAYISEVVPTLKYAQRPIKIYTDSE